MCIMEVREGQRSSTIAQACAHNVSTVERDMDMFEALLTKRAEHSGSQDDVTCLERVQDAHKLLRSAYATLLNAYAAELSGVHPATDTPLDASETSAERVIAHEHAVPQDHEHASESMLNAAIAAGVRRADHDARDGRKYETR